MYAPYIAALFMLLGTVLSSLTLQTEQRTVAMRALRVQGEQSQIAQALVRYREETGQMPVSLDQLVSHDGYEYLASYRNVWQAYALSGTLSDGTWQFQRAATWHIADGDSPGVYANANGCGSGSVYEAVSWCGRRDGVWYRLESKEAFADEIAQEKRRQRRTLQMLSDYWSAKQDFPNSSAGGAVPVGQMQSLPALVGYSGTANQCRGVHVWMGLPLDCAALFDVWGNPVGYQYQDSRYVILASEAPFARADGQRLIVASPLHIQG